MDRKRAKARRPIRSLESGDHVGSCSGTMPSVDAINEWIERGKWITEGGEQGRVGDERKLTDQSEVWHLEATWDRMAGRCHPWTR